jgi:UDP-N-acetylglucosamine--N-acetylmuramyl-(pentapeptide) pyrophosphoryl-undecaprenol N-acetylglucosamine transferase
MYQQNSSILESKNPRILISGGGTGGHVFPAIAIADAIKVQFPNAAILFVGAQEKLEMQAVPKAGYPIKGLWISGFDRSFSKRNLLFPVKVMNSIWQSFSILSRFKPDVVVGVGGYASGPALFAASLLKIPVVIQEQNSFAGVTNKILARFARKICVAFPDMEVVFPKEKLVLTGNPVRKSLYPSNRPLKADACKYFNLDPSKKVVFVAGGSMGARTINQAIINGKDSIQSHSDIQFIWQCGKLYATACLESESGKLDHVKVCPFIEDMSMAYQAADLIVCRAGALSIAEICLLGKPAILVPSPNVAEDHQTKNALSLQQNAAALTIKDKDASVELLSEIYKLIDNKDWLDALGRNASRLGFPDATEKLAEIILQYVPLDKKKVEL